VLKNGESGQFHQIELMGGGVAVIDYNNNGCAEIGKTIRPGRHNTPAR